MKYLISLALIWNFSLKAEVSLSQPDFMKAQQLLQEIEQKNDPQKGHNERLMQSLNVDGLSVSEILQKGENKCRTCSTQQSDELSSFLTSSPQNVSQKDIHLIVFVSLSLGEATLKQLYHDVSRLGGKLVLRGLYKNSFKETQKMIKELEINVEIDPPLFEQFHVTLVPTFILTTYPVREIPGPYDVLHGNVSVAYALEIFVKEGSILEASRLLRRLRRGGE